MTQFMLAHPWITFWLGICTLITIDSIFSNLAKAIVKRKKEDKE